MLFANNYHGYVPYRLNYHTLTHKVLADYQNPFASTHSLDTNPFDDPPPQSASSIKSVSPEEAARLAEIRRREEDLARRESELNNKAEHIRRHGRNNFPPCQCSSHSHFASHLIHLPVFPLIFHSIKDEIPEDHRQLITRLYQLWLVLFGTLVINMIACICILVAGSASGGSDLGASIG
jgi:secretory carrier-associated membrane protein